MVIIESVDIGAAVKALKQGKVVVIPTETSYGMAVDSTNQKAVKRLYLLKGRDFNKPIHVLVFSRAQARALVNWNRVTDSLVRNFWPGPLTIVAKIRGVSRCPLDTLTAGTGFLGVRMSSSKVVLDILKKFKHPITATSANVAGKPDCYSIDDVIRQFRGNRNKPDILVDGRVLPHQKPSTVVKIDGDNFEVLREGTISSAEVKRVVSRIK